MPSHRIIFDPHIAGHGAEILNALGIPYTKNGVWLSSYCPVHNGDNKTAFAFNLNTGRWRCFTHHCHEEKGDRLIDLICTIKQMDKNQAKNWVCQFRGEPIVMLTKEGKEDQIYREVMLKRLFKTDFYLKRGFLQSTLDDFEHGMAEAYKMRGRVTFPVRDDESKIRGWSGRWGGKEIERDGKTICVTDAGKEIPKWKHTSFRKARYLFNYYRIPNPCGFIIVVESIGNVMRFWECGFKNAVACLGSAISPIQAQLLMKKTNHIVLAFDNDPAGIKATQKSFKMLEQYVKVSVLAPRPGKDWAETSNEEVMNYAAKYIAKPPQAI